MTEPKTHEQLVNFYKQRINRFSDILKRKKRINRITGYLRGCIFLCTIIFCYLFWEQGTGVISAIVIVSLFPFAYLVRQNNRLSKIIRHLTTKIAINRNELSALNGDFSAFDSGDGFVDYNHRFSYDLDLFGKTSVFQYINRTSTPMGRKMLAKWLKTTRKEKNDIEKRQEAAEELSKKTDWRHDFQTTGDNISPLAKQAASTKQQNENSDFLSSEMMNWLNEPMLFAGKRIFSILRMAMPVAAFFFLGLLIFDVISFLLFVLFVFVQLSIIGNLLKKINYLHSKVSRKSKVLREYACMLHYIESQTFSSKMLTELQVQLKKEKKSAGEYLHDLSQIISALDNRLNPLFAVLTNTFLAWDLQYVIKLEKWKQQCKDLLPGWFDTIAQFEALSSMGNVVLNHPDFTFPKIESGNFILESKQAGHLLIPSKQRVCNDFSIPKSGFFTIITGANMAGKSTFLRTIGVNLVMAMCGLPVCAAEFRFCPIDVFTSVRMNDSLQKNESYFYAELKRLKTLITELQKEKNLFIIIDEMLKGTNSRDKHFGSVSLIKRLIALNGTGIIATHDISLGELAKEFPKKLLNKRFEVDIKGDKLVFDYKLKNGISQNLNATFLMKQMEIIESKNEETKNV